MSISSAPTRPDLDALDAVVSDAMLQAFQACANSEQNVTPATTLYQIDVDSLRTADICAVVHSCLKNQGIVVRNDIVDHAVQDALTDPSASVKAVVRAVQFNLHAELSRASLSV